MPRLIVTKGADEGKQFDLTGEAVSVGRDKTNTLTLHDTEVSRRHLELRRRPDGQYRLVDLGSANGTSVNRQPVRDIDLKPGDHIQVGQSVMVYTGSSPAAAGDLAGRIQLITRGETELAGGIIKTLRGDEGSRLLARPDQASQWLRERLANLAVMYQASHAVSHILDIDRLLARIMELIFDPIDADHGCVMLRDPDRPAATAVKAVRGRAGADPSEPVAVSGSVVEHVLKHNEGVLVSDAANDARFDSGESIARYRIREVICVPMKGRHDVVGVLYFDTKGDAADPADPPPSRFTKDHLALAGAVAHQAALAVEESRNHEALLQAERLAAVGQTVAAVSHHIKNVMHGSMFGGELINKGLADGDDELVAKGWRMVERNQAKIHALVLDMLSYSKEREPALEWVDLNRLAEEALDIVRGPAEDAGVRLEFRPSPKLGQIPADPEGVHRALLNIVGNAVDAARERWDGVEGGEGAYVAVQTRQESADWARVIVLDNGVGIPREDVEHIFKPFVSTKGARGTGLGLAVSRKSLREHGGDIFVESEPGKGSKFVLRLPTRNSALGGDPTGTAERRALPPEAD